MALTPFFATATTCDVAPGSEEMTPQGVVQIRGRIFTDLVESTEPYIAGTNRPTLNLDFNPSGGDGQVRGTFALSPRDPGGVWEGELTGHFESGLVRAVGLARGTGRLTGAVLHVEFRQVAQLPGAPTPPCADPKAFFEMTGTILRPD
jgi:hypothetical protein